MIGTLAAMPCSGDAALPLWTRVRDPMIRTLAAMPCSVLLCLGSAADAGAQQSAARGWMVGLDFGGSVVAFETAPPDAGALVGARIGYGLRERLSLYLGIYEADADVREFEAFDKVTFGRYDLGVRLHPAAAGRRWVPFADVAFTDRIVSDVLRNGERSAGDFSGAVLSLGGGLAVHLSDAWALDVSAKWGRGEFRDVRTGDAAAGAHEVLDVQAAAVRLTVGVSWWP